MNRRDFGGLVAGTAVAGIAGTGIAADEKAVVQVSEDQLPVMHTGRRPEIAMLIYPGLTIMDMLGPHTALAPACNVHLVWKNSRLLKSDTGVVLQPSMSLADCPKELDAIFVGGGPGQLEVMKDAEVLRFMADRGSRAKWVTSVCTGSLILGAAGLLKGYKATSHWAAHEALAMFGATPVAARVVTDRNRVTGGGVTAGIDFGLTLLASMLSEDIAKLSQLGMEYDPAPPFDAGSPKKAGEKITKMALDWMAPVMAKMVPACAAAAAEMNRYAPKP